MNMVKCWKCGYEWVSRKDSPKECPECKIRLNKKPKVRA